MPHLDLELTDVGAQNIDKILEAIFSYLLMMKVAPRTELERLYQQEMKMQKTRFKFLNEGTATHTVKMLSSSMFYHDEVDIIRANELFLTFDINLIQDTIEMLNQRNFNLLLIDDKHETFDKKEKYYDVEYQEVDFPKAYQKLWDERKLNPEFHLEKANPFVAESFDIFSNEIESQVSD
jgi:secreted Zn-dependent insulinase-like peptidase